MEGIPWEDRVNAQLVRAKVVGVPHTIWYDADARMLRCSACHCRFSIPTREKIGWRWGSAQKCL